MTSLVEFAFLPAESGRRPCATCAMIANVDPDFHAERYGHAPTIGLPGETYRWDGTRQTFVRES